MTHEFRVNGISTLILRATSDVERAILKAMADRAKKGATVTMDGDDGEFFIAVNEK